MTTTDYLNSLIERTERNRKRKAQLEEKLKELEAGIEQTRKLFI